MKHKNRIGFAAAALFVLVARSAEATEGVGQVGGLFENPVRVDAFQGARIFIEPGKVLENGTLVIRDGLIVSVGADSRIPADATIHDASDLSIYPGLIDLSAHFGLAAPAADTTGAHHWNRAMRAGRRAAALFQGDEATEEKYRKAGFTSVLLTPEDGVFQGEPALISLAKGKPARKILPSHRLQGITLTPPARKYYPHSLMGVIAFQRQTFLDAAWYADARNAALRRKPPGLPPERNLDLEALHPVLAGERSLLWKVNDEWGALRASRVADEAGVSYILVGSGFEYRRLNEIRALQVPIVVPLDFPRPEVGTAKLNPLASDDGGRWISLRELRHMVLAPENPGRLARAGVDIALTAAGLDNVADLHARVGEAIARGLDEETALAALTTVPARLIGAEGNRGRLNSGYAADFIIVEGDLFDADLSIRESWIGGVRQMMEEKTDFEPGQQWTLAVAGSESDADDVKVMNFELGGSAKAITGSLQIGDSTSTLNHLDINRLSLTGSFSGDAVGYPGAIRFDAVLLPDRLDGHLTLSDGNRLAFQGTPKETEGEEKSESSAGDDPAKSEVSTPPSAPTLPDLWPSGAYGRSAQPEMPGAVLVRNATIWTSGPEGVLEEADLLVRRGKVSRVGKGLQAPDNAVVIDGTGKHVTPGLIDCHSHTAIAGDVNEGNYTVSAEVRITDVIDPDRIELYRQLSGGLTIAHQLHGSANPIGGQNSVIKLRWGLTDKEMIFDKAPSGIKFALGENVKRSNWGESPYAAYYPHTRMGVEQIIIDRLQAALDYRARHENHKRAPGRTIIPRTDLELEALLEVLNGDRLVHCHAYRQDEILMLIRVAERFGFTIGTFQHVLEGYKVADAIAAHGAGASTFSDWWGYKFEVYDAIPYNGALMHEAGANVSFNSDNHELARRLNYEAAKAVKYGGVSDVDAVKFITLNPAIQLGIDEYVGSIEPGKDADFVIWDGPPLSTQSHCEETWIDGRRYFDIHEDSRMRRDAKREQESIIQYLLTEKKPDKKAPSSSGKEEDR